MIIKTKKHIEIVRSTATNLSSMGPKTSFTIEAALAARYSDVHISIINNLQDLEALVAKRPDLVFVGMKFLPVNPALGISDTNRIWVNQYLNDHGIATTGSGAEAYELEFDKALAKQRVFDAGLQTSPFYVIPQTQEVLIENKSLGYPVFIKPTNLGGGRGIDNNSVAYNFASLKTKVASLSLDLQADAMVEEFLSGREFSVAILKNEHDGDFMIMPLELIAPANNRGERMLSEKIKSGDTETFIAVTDPALLKKISSLALNVFHALGARDFGRIDIRLDKFEVAHFLEANLIPSLMKDYGNFPKACMINASLGYEDMINHIVRLAFNRSIVIVDEAEDEFASTILGIPVLV